MRRKVFICFIFCYYFVRQGEIAIYTWSSNYRYIEEINLALIHDIMWCYRTIRITYFTNNQFIYNAWKSWNKWNRENCFSFLLSNKHTMIVCGPWSAIMFELSLSLVFIYPFLINKKNMKQQEESWILFIW